MTSDHSPAVRFHSRFARWTAAVLLAALCPAAFSQERTPDVLIIYSSGTPEGTISESGADAVTLPTPKGENIRTVSERLGALLRERGMSVRVAPADEVRTAGEILDAGMVVFGSPSYFNNVSWEIKRCIDLQFSPIYSRKERLGGKTVAAFCMAEIAPSAEATLAILRHTVLDCRGTFGPTMTFLVEHPADKVAGLVNAFADDLARIPRK